MSFPIGSTVVLLSLGRKRGIVIGAGREGHYRVQVENAVVSCREHDLAEAPDESGKKSKNRKRLGASASNLEDVPVPAAVRRPLDLHGLTVDDAIARVVTEIDEALRGGADRIQIVHGKGSGRIQQALHRHLATMSVVKSFKIDPNNIGVTWVYF